jgi:hypothetical protein
MLLEWNYNETCTGETASGKTSEINIELRDTVIKLFKNSLDYHDLDLVSKYQRVFETLTFIFEDYRQSFENIMKKRMGIDLTSEQQQVEAIVFCSWVSIEVMASLSNQDIRT